MQLLSVVSFVQLALLVRQLLLFFLFFYLRSSVSKPSLTLTPANTNALVHQVDATVTIVTLVFHGFPF